MSEITMNRRDDKIVFEQGTELLIEVPVAVVVASIEFATEWATVDLPEVNVEMSRIGNYEVSIHKWWENPVDIVIRKYNTLVCLVRFEADGVDNLIGDLLETDVDDPRPDSQLLEGRPTDEEIQIASWSEGRGYGDFPEEVE